MTAQFVHILYLNSYEARSLLDEARNVPESAPMEAPAHMLQNPLPAPDTTPESMVPDPSTTRSELPASPLTGWGNHSVYVVVLDPAVWGRSRFREENPDHVPGMP